MKTFRRLLSRFKGSTFQRQDEGRFEQEIAEHLALETAENIRAGMPPVEARRQAMLKFGALEAVKEQYRSERSLPLIEALLRDSRYAVRQLRNSPAFALTAIVTLALGIGATTAIFSVINAVILQPLPFPDPDRLLSVRSLYTRHAPRPDELSYPNFFDFRAYNHVFQHLVSYRDNQFSLKTHSSPLHVDAEVVSWDLFPALGVTPIYGRGFLPEEEKPGTNVAILSYRLWRSQFNEDRSLLGRSIVLNGKPFTVIGIAPKNFYFPVEEPDVQLWTTLAQDATAPAGIDPLTIQRGARLIDAIGRLKPGVTLEQARAQMNTVAATLAKQYPDDNKNVARTSIRPELEEILGFTREPLLILMGAVGLLLLIACLNVANLLLSRTTERTREFALRTAIGASRTVILRQILTESVSLALLGSFAGIVFALASIPLLVRLAGSAVPRLENTHIDSRVLLFAIGLAFVSAVLFSLAPLAQIAKIELVEFVKEGTRTLTGGRDRVRGAFVVAQLALGLVLLSGATLLAATFFQLETRDPGFKADHLLRFQIDLPDAQYPIEKQIQFNDRLLERVAALPSVESVASGWPMPFESDQAMVSFDIKERPAPAPQRPHADIAIVTPDFFRTLRIPLIRGRAFTQHDDTDAPPVVIVNQAFADRFFPGEDAIGKRIQSGAANGTKGVVTQTIVGIVANARQSALKPDWDPIYYFPYKQLSWGFGWTIVRTSMPPHNLESAVRSAVTALESQAPVHHLGTVEDAFNIAMAPPRFHTWLLGAFAAIALLLTMVGVYGVTAYSVSKRTREIGVRMAVGADRETILRLVFKQAAILASLGMVFGLTAAMFSNRLLERIPYAIQFNNWLLLTITAAGMALTCAIAAYWPARRAASIDPVQALRVE